MRLTLNVTVFKVTEMKLQHDNTLHEMFTSCWKPLSSTGMDPNPEDSIKTCISELVGKINGFKKNWDVTGRRHMQHDKGHASGGYPQNFCCTLTCSINTFTNC